MKKPAGQLIIAGYLVLTQPAEFRIRSRQINLSLVDINEFSSQASRYHRVQRFDAYAPLYTNGFFRNSHLMRGPVINYYVAGN
jgi:hypothetical protein